MAAVDAVVDRIALDYCKKYSVYGTDSFLAAAAAGVVDIAVDNNCTALVEAAAAANSHTDIAYYMVERLVVPLALLEKDHNSSLL